ncbi:MAG: sporulation protein YabP [Ruminococcaceae bacterium]|nr:sporulation protein YabP [Oscillospiraceae bacterium]
MAERMESTKRAAQNIILESRQRMSVSGVEEVLAFDERIVEMKTGLGELRVQGEELKVEKLTVDDGELVICGHITAIVYAEPAVSLRQRLFG